MQPIGYFTVYAVQAVFYVPEYECTFFLQSFIREISPVAESCSAFLAIHPDDPPRKLLGLPRIVSTEKDVRELLGEYLS